MSRDRRPKVVVRADSSSIIGSGHLVRCATLARALRDQGAEILFVSREHEGHLIDTFEKEFAFVRLPPPRHAVSMEDPYDLWLGDSIAGDASATLKALRDFGGADWMITDHYGISAAWEARLKANLKILAIDDLANRKHDCDVLLDQSLDLHEETRYEKLIPPAALQLLGPAYALLHPSFRTVRELKTKPGEEVRKIGVYLGSMDLNRMTIKTAEALLQLSLESTAVHFICGKLSPDYENLRKLIESRQGWSLSPSVNSMADFLLSCDIAIGAAGMTTWERACVGVPSLVISLADNQLLNGQTLDRVGVQKHLGWWKSLNVSDIRDGALALIQDLNTRISMYENGRSTVDGLGLQRVLETLK